MKRTILFLLLLACQQVMSAATDSEAVSRLVALGLENVRVAAEGRGTVYASFEPAGYRGTYRGAAAALKELSSIYPETHSFRIFLIEDQLPRVALTATNTDDIWNISGDYDFSEYETTLSERPKENSSAAKVDLTVYPMFTWINHVLDQPFEYVLSIAPALQTSLWEGNRIILQPVFPVSYDTKTINSGLGLDLRMGWNATPNLTISAEASLTGEALVRDGKYDIGKLDKVSAFAKAEYYEPYTRFQGQVMAGRFIFGDYGARMDISRHFGDYTIGVYGVLTGGEHNAGFHFAIPFGPRHYKRSGAFRIKLPDYFDWEYSMVSYYDYYNKQMGKTVEMRPDENRSAHYWQATHVAQYTEKVLNDNFIN